MRSLDECKAAIRKLSIEDRTQLILWLSHGMPADETQGSDQLTRKSPRLDSNSLSLEETQRLAMEGTKKLAGLKFTEVPKTRLNLNEPPPLPPFINE